MNTLLMASPHTSNTTLLYHLLPNPPSGYLKLPTLFCNFASYPFIR